MAGLADIRNINPAQQAVETSTDSYLRWKAAVKPGTPFNPIPLISMREGGNREDVYLDSEGKPTAGVGHLLTKDERKRYSKGSIVSPEVRQRWFEQDSEKAINAAILQAKEMGVSDPRFIETLTSVNFQLGTSWNKEHVDTWDLMKNRDYSGAAKEAENSLWFEQTPARVRDLQQALVNLNPR